MTTLISSIPVKARPYLMRNQVQHYAWGTRNDDAYIPRLLGIKAQPDVPYAELWMGAHSKASSSLVIDGTSVPLDQWIAAHPFELLGQAVSERFSGKLPFLFKVLSTQEALSIQAHPNKVQAEALHASDPEHYPDDNHKPELAVVLDSLTALVGIKSLAGILDALDRYRELADFVGQEACQELKAVGNPAYPEQQDLVREFFSALITGSVTCPEALHQALDSLAERLGRSAGELREEERLFLDLRKTYAGADVGLFAIFLLNLVHLRAGEGVFTPAGVPHAYLKGNIVECMANSDNVVRVGLTPKFKDAEALIDILDCQPGVVALLEGEPSSAGVAYRPPFEEFQVNRWQVEESGVRDVVGSGPRVFLVTRGEVRLSWGSGLQEGAQVFRKGQSFFVPALLEEFRLKALGCAELFEAGVP